MVEVRRADDVEELGKKKISLIKIDVEGHELSVLKGARGLIKKDRPIILFEQHQDDFSNGTSAVVDFIRGFNYKFYTIERSYDFQGSSVFFRFTGLILRSVLGYKLVIAERNLFKNRFYDMVIAMPDYKSLK